MDLKEVNPYLRSLARFPLQAAFRYHRQPAEIPTLALEWTRFPDSTVLAAVAEHAVVTTLVTVEGRTLTEVKLTVKNQAQPFLKVGLPKGATIVSAEVAGEKVKPVQGPDGNRVPLLRAGFRPNGPYEVSFVFMDSGTPFAKKGGSELALPSMDVPISLLEWELFLPEQYRVKDFGGDAIAAYLLPAPMVEDDQTQISSTFSNTNGSFGVRENEGMDRLALFVPGVVDGRLGRGQLSGVVTDQTGAVVQGAQVKITLENGGTMSAKTDSAGQWLVSGLPSGPVGIVVSAQGFQSAQLHTQYDSGRPSRYDARLNVGTASETVEVTASAPLVETSTAEVRRGRKKDRDKERDEKKAEALAQNGASSNVLDLQKRVAGVLPVRVDVPRAGNSYRFARALVLDEETKVTFSYKTK
jgi:hypothetical protein